MGPQDSLIVEVIRMTITHTIIQAKDLIRITVIGGLDSRTIEKIVANLAKARSLAVQYDILLDGRQAYSTITDSHLIDLIGVLSQYRFVFRNKIAILCPGPKSSKTRFWEQSCREAGFRVVFFHEFEDAMNWLSPGIYFDIDYDGETLPGY